MYYFWCRPIEQSRLDRVCVCVYLQNALNASQIPKNGFNIFEMSFNFSEIFKYVIIVIIRTVRAICARGMEFINRNSLCLF